jgi:hypothetical protein
MVWLMRIAGRGGSMTAEVLRDAAATAAVFGFFASAWFGWAQDEPPRAWRKALIAGSVLSLLTAVGGGVITWRTWSGPTVFDAGTSRTFGVVVGVEVALAGVGAAVLARRRRSELVPAWVALVVGVHLVPVAVLVRSPLIAVTGVLVTLAALAAVPLARSRAVAVSAVTGFGAGTVLLVAALWSLASVPLWS